jgi:hypothetical protein
LAIELCSFGWAGGSNKTLSSAFDWLKVRIEGERMVKFQKSTQKKYKVVKGVFYRLVEEAQQTVIVYPVSGGFVYPSNVKTIDAYNLPLFSLDDQLYQWQMGVHYPTLFFKCLIQEEIVFLRLDRKEQPERLLRLWEGE